MEREKKGIVEELEQVENRMSMQEIVHTECPNWKTRERKAGQSNRTLSRFLALTLPIISRRRVS